MEIEIESKRNNPLLNRTEVYFTVKHPGEGTPNRDIIRSELADKLNVKKENVVVNTVRSSFGIQEISGYAKVYSSVQKTIDSEQDYILARNKIIETEKKLKKAAPTPKAEGVPKPDAGISKDKAPKPPEDKSAAELSTKKTPEVPVKEPLKEKSGETKEKPPEKENIGEEIEPEKTKKEKKDE